MSATIIVVVSTILFVVLLVALILLLHWRRGKKGMSTVGKGTNDWPSQPQQGAWNQQGLGGWSQQQQPNAYYSRVVPTMTWNTLLVYAHIEAALQAVREDALKFKEEIGSLTGEASAWAALPMTRGTQITVVPTCQGRRFNPERFVFTWIEDWHQIKFRFQIDQRLANAIGSGEITMYAGPLIIGSVKVCATKSRPSYWIIVSLSTLPTAGNSKVKGGG